jgi:hypothetical protein
MNCMYTAFMAGVLAFAVGASVFAAEETSPPASPAETTAPARDAGKDDLTPEERAEKQARKNC